MAVKAEEELSLAEQAEGLEERYVVKGLELFDKWGKIVTAAWPAAQKNALTYASGEKLSKFFSSLFELGEELKKAHQNVTLHLIVLFQAKGLNKTKVLELNNQIQRYIDRFSSMLENIRKEYGLLYDTTAWATDLEDFLSKGVSIVEGKLVPITRQSVTPEQYRTHQASCLRSLDLFISMAKKELSDWIALVKKLQDELRITGAAYRAALAAAPQQKIIDLLTGRGIYEKKSQGERRDLWNRWVRISKQRTLLNADLKDADLRGFDFSNFRFIGKTDLEGSDLSAANLSGADLQGINLGHVNFSNANLSGANFSRTRIFMCQFDNANLSKANFAEAEISASNFIRSNIKGTNFKGVNAVHTLYVSPESSLLKAKARKK